MSRNIPRMMKDEKEIHPQMQRLYQAAEVLRGKKKKSDVARLLHVSDQLLNSWEKRGIAEKQLLPMARALGCGFLWLKDNSGDMQAEAPITATDLSDVIDLLSYYGRMRAEDRELVLRFARSLLQEG
jgi:hypothetical protein